MFGPEGSLEIIDSDVNGSIITIGIDNLTLTNNEINGSILSTNDGAVELNGNTIFSGKIEVVDPSSCTESMNDVPDNDITGCFPPP